MMSSANRLKMILPLRMCMLGLLLGASFIVSCEAGLAKNDPFCCNSYEDLRSAASNIEQSDQQFSDNINKLLTNFFTSPQLVPYPWPATPGTVPANPNNPNPPTIQISPSVGTCGNPIPVDGGVCVPLCCSCCGTGSELTVLAMDSATTFGSGDPNGFLPNLKPIVATDLHLCCGDEVNSAFHDHAFKIEYDSFGETLYYNTKYHATGQCQLVSGVQSPILPVRITANCQEPVELDECPDWYVSEEDENAVNYPVRVF
eukprot:626322_1